MVHKVLLENIVKYHEMALPWDKSVYFFQSWDLYQKFYLSGLGCWTIYCPFKTIFNDRFGRLTQMFEYCVWMFERVGVMKANMLTIMFECWEKILGEFYILPNVNVKCFHSGL